MGKPWVQRFDKRRWLPSQPQLREGRKGEAEFRQPLIVDKDHSIRLALRTILANDGFRVVEATQGEEALAHAPQFDAVLLDIEMPDMNGLDACMRMR